VNATEVHAVPESRDAPNPFVERGQNGAIHPRPRSDRDDAAETFPSPLSSILYAQDHGLIHPSELGNELSEIAARYANEAQSAYQAICREETGTVIPPERIKETEKAASELLAQSHAIAAKMVSAGFNCYRDTPFCLFRYNIHSGHVEKLPAFRRICFIPYVAQSVRAQVLAAVESLLERHLFARFWTFTSGRRVPLRNLRPRIQWLHRRISELNAADFMRDAGAEIVFRSTELGTPETDSRGSFRGNNAGTIERNDKGTLFFHVHAHCVVILKKGRISPGNWEHLLRKVHEFMKRQWDDGGSIRDARECCKYVTKPGEMLKLTGSELVELQAQLSRLKLVQPMGLLAEEIKARREKGLRLVKRPTPEGRVFAEVRDWNRHGKQTGTEANFEAAQKLGKVRREEVLRIVARLLPASGPAGVKEPRVVVMATTWDEVAVRNHPLVARMIQDTAEEFQRGLAIRVHTCTPTVGETRSLSFADSLAPPRHVPTGAELAGFSR
jgi:hypothetical protein